jgi:hypothetical protein
MFFYMALGTCEAPYIHLKDIVIYILRVYVLSSSKTSSARIQPQHISIILNVGRHGNRLKQVSYYFK